MMPSLSHLLLSALVQLAADKAVPADPLPRLLFKEQVFRASEDPSIKAMHEAIRVESGSAPRPLPASSVRQLSKATQRLFQRIEGIDHLDARQIESLLRFYPLVAWAAPEGTVNYLVFATGDDFAMDILYRYSPATNTLHAIRIKGGLCGGSIATNDQVDAPCMEEIAKLQSDTLTISMRHIASFHAGPRPPIRDSGSIAFRIQAGKLDTLWSRGITTESAFLKKHHLNGQAIP